MSILIKKAAMFGLDARIALAIFGALSVISGAALYSAISESKAVALYQNLLEINKASEAYYLDTGSKLPFIVGDTNSLKAGNLISNQDSESGWAGPYISYEQVSANNFYTRHSGLNFATYFYRFANDSWSSSIVGCSSATSGCYEWIMIDGTNAEKAGIIQNLFDTLNDRFDTGTDHATGAIRMYTVSATRKQLFVRGLLRSSTE
tara:strand:- start:7266 stop:7880 length:615 start_codon:yes stop_codon:yes gene_type:complete